jgi:hypothetical protein
VLKLQIHIITAGDILCTPCCWAHQTNFVPAMCLKNCETKDYIIRIIEEMASKYYLWKQCVKVYICVQIYMVSKEVTFGSCWYINLFELLGEAKKIYITHVYTLIILANQFIPTKRREVHKNWQKVTCLSRTDVFIKQK